MAVPQAVLAGGWIPFVVVLVLSLVFSWIYIRYFQHHELSEVSSTLVAVFALSVTLLTSALVPVDVFLVSYMKNADGSFKSWAVDAASRKAIEDSIMYAYYALYGCVSLFIFVILPFMYFYFEERDDDVSTKSRCCTALKYSFVFILFAVVILITGAFVPLKTPPKNMTSFGDKLNYLKVEFSSYSDGEKSISILVGCLSLVGMLTIVMYTGYGMSAFPIGMLSCCKPSPKDEEEPNSRGLTQRERTEEKARRLRAKSASGRNLSRWERRQLHQIEQEERLQRRVDRREFKAKHSICGKITRALKPFKVFFGIFFLLISLLIMTSLVITNIDKAQNSLGYRYGYTLPKPTYTNPVNAIMVYAQKVFPLDYILFVGITMFFVFASMSGLKQMGIWCCFIKMYKIRARRTMPQALIFMIFILMFMVVALNIMVFTIAPEYVTFGDQKYKTNVTDTIYSNHTRNGTIVTTLVTKACLAESPPELCLTSRLASLINKLFYKAWFFGAFYYWAQWAFIVVFFFGLLVSLVKCRQPVVYYEPDVDDSDSDDEPLLQT